MLQSAPSKVAIFSKRTDHSNLVPDFTIALHPRKNVKDCTIKQKRVTWYILPYRAFLQPKKDSVLLISSLL